MVDTINLVLLPRMQELNSALPPELQLEPFTYVQTGMPLECPARTTLLTTTSFF